MLSKCFWDCTFWLKGIGLKHGIERSRKNDVTETISKRILLKEKILSAKEVVGNIYNYFGCYEFKR